MKNKQNDKMSVVLITAALMIVFTALFAASTIGLTDTTRPTIDQVWPTNNQLDAATHDTITILFSEPMNPASINTDTIMVMQRTTPAAGSPSSEFRSRQIEGTVTYNGLTAVFTPKKTSQPSYNPLQPSQEFGNVFTATVTSGAEDLAGNSLSQDYMWSFTTGIYQFNSGTTTSQTDQAFASGATTAPTQTTPPATIPAAAVTQESTGSWYTSPWFLGGLFLLLLVTVILALNIRPSRQKSPQKTSHKSDADPFGDTYPVMSLEGIGPVYKKALQAMGISNTKQLWKANAAKIAFKTGAPLSSVRSWQEMAELSSVKGIGPQSAELLERSGIHSISQLQSIEPDKLLALVHEKQNALNVNIQGNTPGHATVENWIDAARNHEFSESREGQTA